MSTIRALAAPQAHARLEASTYDPGPLGDEQVEIVPGHEAVGTVSAVGRSAKLVGRANEAMAHLAAGKARYRIVLKSDL
jgi:D-arabinose 1-dehydrogenase-like Zn-dependent alcohol dehydrogenase